VKKKIDFLVVGAGFFGSVIAERIANILKKEVLIVDKRDHIGGNCYSEIEPKTQIEYHKYGTHIFHTSNKKVWEYLSQFTEFNNYRHQVLSNYMNKIYQLPINLETINSFFNKNFSPSQAQKFIYNKTSKFKKNKYFNFEEKAISQIGEELYGAFIKGYTYKQWGKDPNQLPQNIFNRLPLRFNYQEDYFKECMWQGIPKEGYTNVFKNILKNKRIKIDLNYKFNLTKRLKPKYATIYTGPLDELLDYRYGKLEWRSLEFKKEIVNDVNDFQGTSVINYPEKRYKFTRIHEPKHLHLERKYNSKSTLIIKEYSNGNYREPYYPIGDKKNRTIHRKYKHTIEKEKNFFIGGRLADYAYYDMDMTISAALVKFEKLIKSHF
jgi:UDP-galactopyranose mutase